MKKLLLGVATLIFAGCAIAEDFERGQLNFRLRSSDYGLEIREELNSNKDHVQLSYFGVKNVEVRYRYVDEVMYKEHRPQISYNAYQGQTFFIRPRLDYRYFTGNKPDYFSFRTTVGAEKIIAPSYKFWAEVIPIWDVGQGKENDLALDKTQTKIGFEYFDTKIRFGPFIQYETTGHLDHTETFLGTNLFLNY